MSMLHNTIKRSVEYHEEDTELLGNICRNTSTTLDCDTGGEVIAGGPNMEAEKRIRREIANSNERRRMQSINAGFQSLRTLLPHHEGEKLSKAAILQQTAEYIYNLEQEKTRLLSQNCQLMRQVQQHEGDVPPKKRIKTELITPITTIAPPPPPDPLDEPKSSATELIELRRLLDRERSLRVHLEDQIRTMESQIYQQIQYQEHTDTETIVTVIQEPSTVAVEDDAGNGMELIQPDNVPIVGQTETVVCCSPQISRSSSPIPEPVEEEEEEPEQRLPSVLEAAIKAEPKVEVERLPTPPNDDVTCSRLYVANTSRQNLETIVEAIRHLEGDHLFGDEACPQDTPLALTTKTKEPAAVVAAPIKIEMNHYLQFHTVAQQQQQRPGVIVVKQHS